MRNIGRTAATAWTVLTLAWMAGGAIDARACEKTPTAASATAAPAPAAVASPVTPAGTELLGIPSPRESAVPAAAVAPVPAAPSASPTPPAIAPAPAPTRLIIPGTSERIVALELGDLSLLQQGLDAGVKALEQHTAEIDAAREALERSSEWLAGGTTPSTKTSTSTRTETRTETHPRHERMWRRSMWGEDEDHTAVRTDTTIAVRKGMVFVLENFGGSIALKTWAKNAVRVRANHGKRSWVAVSTGNGRLDISSQAKLGPPGAVDYEITMPQWMNTKLSGVYNDVTAEGLENGLTVETVSGDIRAMRVAGDIALRSVQGTVVVDGAKGNLQVSSVNDGVRVVNMDGPIAAEAVNGDIQLVDLRSKMVEATTVSGEVVYDGTIFDDGDYRFSTHNGDIALVMPDASNATVSVATFSGEFEQPFPVRIKKLNKDKRFYFKLGSGAAKVNLESFDGAIQLFKPGDKMFKTFTMSEWMQREKEREKNREERRMKREMKDKQDQEDQDEEDDN